MRKLNPLSRFCSEIIGQATVFIQWKLGQEQLERLGAFCPRGSLMSRGLILTGSVCALKNEAALRDHSSFGVSWGSQQPLIGWERKTLNSSEAVWTQTLEAELVTRNPDKQAGGGKKS